MFLHRNKQQQQQQPSELNDKLVGIIKENAFSSLEEQTRDINVSESNFVLDINQRKNQRDEPVDNFKDDRITLLHVAAFYDSLECFVYLHKEKDIRLDAPSVKSYFPLHYACYNGSREVVSYILSKDKKLAAELPPNITHHYLYFAVYGGDPVILAALFDGGADLKKPQNIQDDPIGKSIDISNIECLKVLLDHEDHLQNKDNRTPAMLAAHNCHPRALEILIKSSEDLAFFSSNNESIFTLMFSYSNGAIFKNVIIDLLTKYPDTRIDPPEELRIAGVCHWICKMCDPQVAELMIRTPDVIINRLDDSDRIGPYYLSMQKDFRDGDSQSTIKILKILISAGLDLNFRKNETHPTVLEVFSKAMKVRYNVIEFLLNNGADPYASYSRNTSVSLYDEVMSNRVRDRELKTIFKSFAQK